MKLLHNEELLKITGGAITAAFMTALVRGINAYLDVGRSLGSAIRRVITKSICSV
jgi:hypothetical protein